MRIAVFGATGGSGRSLVEQALERGDAVTVLARRPETLKLTSPSLKIVEGDALDPDAVTRVVEDAEAVACVLGLPKGEGTSISEGTRNICAAMRKVGVDRLVAVTVMGLGDSENSFSLVGKAFVRLFLKKGMEDRARQEFVIRESGLDYTIVRPTRLVDGPRTGRYSVGPDVRAGMSSKVIRADLAHCVLSQLQTTGSDRPRAVSIAGL